MKIIDTETGSGGGRAGSKPNGKLFAVPLDLAEANRFVKKYHRHNRKVVGHRFSIGVSDAKGMHGVAIVGRPVARALDDGRTAEVTRVCVTDEAPTGCNSFLYAACWRAWRAMGGWKLVTYTLKSESGVSLRAAGWKVVAELDARNVARQGPDRAREWQDVYGQPKLRWEAV